MRRLEVMAASLFLALCACQPEEDAPVNADFFQRMPKRLRGTQSQFRVNTLTTNSCNGFNHNAFTGDDRGSIAVSNNVFFYSGDNATMRTNLGFGVLGTQSPQLDLLTSDLKTGKVYNLADADGLSVGFNHFNQVISGLREIRDDGTEGAFIPLRHSIPLFYGTTPGVFAGWGRIVVFALNHYVNIDPKTGDVTDLGEFSSPQFYGCESFAYWGVAEFYDNSVHVAYKRDSFNIVRRNLNDDTIETIITMPGTDMCAFTVSVANDRWYWHHEGGSPFIPVGTEVAGYCDATFIH